MKSWSPDLSLRWAILLLAASVIVLMGMRSAAAILNPILIALVLALIVAPVYAWLLRQKLPTWLAIMLMLVGQVILFGFLFVMIGASVARLSAQLDYYDVQIEGRVAEIQGQLSQFSPVGAELGTVLNGDMLTTLLDRFTGQLVELLANLVLILILVLFFLSEGPSLENRLRASVSVHDARVPRLATFGRSVIRQFGLRTVVNLITGACFGLFLFLIGVDFPLLWAVLTFFLSYVPYLGIVIAAIPAVLLALAEFGLDRALLVIAGLTVINALAENVLSPTLMGRGLNVSPTVVFLSFTFWFWLLGGAGAFLAMPLTIFIALMLDAYPETRWLASIIFIRPHSDEAGDRASPVANAVDATKRA